MRECFHIPNPGLAGFCDNFFSSRFQDCDLQVLITHFCKFVISRSSYYNSSGTAACNGLSCYSPSSSLCSRPDQRDRCKPALAETVKTVGWVLTRRCCFEGCVPRAILLAWLEMLLGSISHFSSELFRSKQSKVQ